MLSALGLQTPSLKIEALEQDLYLHPSEPGTPSVDPCVTGVVTLTLPKPRAIKQLTVRLVGRCDIMWPRGQRPPENATLLKKVVELVTSDKEIIFDKGVHRFEYSIIVPSSTAPYERSPFGRVMHYVSAKCKGFGVAGSDLISKSLPIYLMVNPGGAGPSSPPPPLAIRVEALSEDFGPYTADLAANHLMVGGLLLVRFRVLFAPCRLAVYAVKVKIQSSYQLASPNDPSFTMAVPNINRPAIMTDAQRPPNEGHVGDTPQPSRSQSRPPRELPLRILESGEQWTLTHLGRVPGDNFVRPTTGPYTETPIRASHNIILEVVYRILGDDEDELQRARSRTRANEEEGKRMLSITKPIELSSCCCFVDSLTLPAYSEKDPFPREELEYVPPCACAIGTKTLADSPHGNGLRDDAGFQWQNDTSRGAVKVQPYSDSRDASRAPSRTPSRPSSRAPSPTNENDRGRPGVSIYPTTSSNASSSRSSFQWTGVQ